MAQSGWSTYHDDILIPPPNYVPPVPSSDPPCIDVQEVMTNCEEIWIRVNMHFFLDDNCEGDLAFGTGDKDWCEQYQPDYLPGCDLSADNAAYIAEMLINRANAFAQNMSNNLPFPNELAYNGVPPQDAKPICMPIRFLLNNVYIHCDSYYQNDSIDPSKFEDYQTNSETEINIFNTNFVEYAGSSGYAGYFANYFVNSAFAWSAPWTFIHEFGHQMNLRNTWQEFPEINDTKPTSWSWDHDCNPSTPPKTGNACWDSEPIYTPIDDKKPGCNNPLFFNNHPCCSWDNQTSNLMAYSGWASNGDYATISQQQMVIMLNTINSFFCSKVVVVDPSCPPPSANIVIPPLTGQGDDCVYCINLGASMNESQYEISFSRIINGTAQPLHNTGWVSKTAGKYCISLNRLKQNSNTLEGGFTGGGTYKITLKVKNECGQEATKDMTFTLPIPKNCGDVLVPKLEFVPNPVERGMVALKLTTENPINGTLIFKHPIYGSYGTQSISTSSAGTSEIFVNTSSWYEGINYAFLVTDEGIFSSTVIIL